MCQGLLACSLVGSLSTLQIQALNVKLGEMNWVASTAIPNQGHRRGRKKMITISKVPVSSVDPPDIDQALFLEYLHLMSGIDVQPVSRDSTHLTLFLSIYNWDTIIQGLPPSQINAWISLLSAEEPEFGGLVEAVQVHTWQLQVTYSILVMHGPWCCNISTHPHLKVCQSNQTAVMGAMAVCNQADTRALLTNIKTAIRKRSNPCSNSDFMWAVAVAVWNSFYWDKFFQYMKKSFSDLNACNYSDWITLVHLLIWAWDKHMMAGAQNEEPLQPSRPSDCSSTVH
ncbi:hypothetical protein BDR04DRAFT_1117529 [Suillus decipiens]|nr:hypothetical protein BDR04DRAFT_1117529 [Suillus decipiens]